MSAASAYTLQEVQGMIAIIKEAIKSITEGTAKEYKIGSRSYTALDLKDLREQLTYYTNIQEVLSGAVRKNRVVRVVPRDL